MIISGGFNVYPLEVEEVLYQLPHVAMAAVVGMPDPRLGEIICACIVLRDGAHLSPEEVTGLCAGQLANYKVPREVIFMEALPVTTGTNKVKKTKLVEMLKSGTLAAQES